MPDNKPGSEQAGKEGIKEISEVVRALGILNSEILAVSMDGFQVRDPYDLALRIVLNPAVRNALVDAVRGIQHIPGEARDLDSEEIMVLGKLVVESVLEGIKGYAEARGQRDSINAVKAARAAGTFKENPGNAPTFGG